MPEGQELRAPDAVVQIRKTGLDSRDWPQPKSGLPVKREIIGNINKKSSIYRPKQVIKP